MVAASPKAVEPRKRVPAAERRDALIEAAMGEFARGGLHGTKVSQVAREVGVAQPYVFTLFPTKVDLFLAAVGRGFERIEAIFATAAERYEANGPECEPCHFEVGINLSCFTAPAFQGISLSGTPLWRASSSRALIFASMSSRCFW